MQLISVIVVAITIIIINEHAQEICLLKLFSYNLRRVMLQHSTWNMRETANIATYIVV